MKNRLVSVVLGLVLVAAGIVFAGNALEFWQVSLFFDGWWTLFLIVPGLVSAVRHGPDGGNIICIAIGVLLLLGQQDVIDMELIWKLAVPAVLVGIGLSLILRRDGGSFKQMHKRAAHVSRDGLLSYTAVFGGQEVTFPAEKFPGARLTAVFGGVELDLRAAVIDQDTFLYATAVFGGCDVLVPETVQVCVSSMPVFGGVENHVQPVEGDNVPTVFIQCVCAFGGVEIK